MTPDHLLSVIECEDVDTTSQRHFMGLVRVELDLSKIINVSKSGCPCRRDRTTGPVEHLWRPRGVCAVALQPRVGFRSYPDGELKPARQRQGAERARLALAGSDAEYAKDKNLSSKGGAHLSPCGAFETFLHVGFTASMACELPDSMPSHALPHRHAIGATLSAASALSARRCRRDTMDAVDASSGPHAVDATSSRNCVCPMACLLPPPRHRRDAIGATLSARCHGTPPQAPRTPSPSSR